MSVDLERTKKCVAMWQRVGVHVCVYECVCVRARAFVCACVCACEERDKASFSG